MDHYENLELDKECDQNDIKKAYHRLSRQYHPDKNKNKGLTNDDYTAIKDRYMKIHKAYTVLSDANSRAEYDRSGASIEHGETIIDPYNAFMQAMDEREDIGIPDVIEPINCSLVDLYYGFNKLVEFKRVSPCTRCHATGTKNKKNGDCTTCKGRGAVLETIDGGLVGFLCKERVCDICRGTGLDPDIECCRICNGNKYEKEMIEYNVDIPEGAYEGYFVKLEGEGNYIPEENRDTDNSVKRERTDVLFLIASVDYDKYINDLEQDDEVINPTYMRGVVIKELKRADRADLMIRLPITFEESICGITKRIRHLDNSIFDIEIDETIVNADTIVLKQKGMPVILEQIDSRKHDETDHNYGDLYIRFEIKRPTLDKGIKRKIWQILTNTSYQKRPKVNPIIYSFLDTLIKQNDVELSTSDHGSYDYSDQ